MKEAKKSKHTAPASKHTLRWVLLALLAVLVLGAGAVGLLLRREMTGAGATGQTVTVTVEQGSGVAAIARDLQQAGVIRFPPAVPLVCGTAGCGRQPAVWHF